jgi:natural product precursor
VRKKTIKKLHLSKETIQKIQSPELKQVAGGLTDSCPLESWCPCGYSDWCYPSYECG